MNGRLPVLESLRIAAPCNEAWDKMRGDDRVRHCDRCDLDVFNLSGMTREEAESLVLARGADMCARFYKRTDGTVLTQDCPIGIRAARRRIAAAVGAWVSLMGASVAAWMGVTLRARTCDIDATGPSAFEQSATLQAVGALLTGNPLPTPTPHKLMGKIAMPRTYPALVPANAGTTTTTASANGTTTP